MYDSGTQVISCRLIRALLTSVWVCTDCLIDISWTLSLTLLHLEGRDKGPPQFVRWAWQQQKSATELYSYLILSRTWTSLPSFMIIHIKWWTWHFHLFNHAAWINRYLHSHSTSQSELVLQKKRTNSFLLTLLQVHFIPGLHWYRLQETAICSHSKSNTNKLLILYFFQDMRWFFSFCLH